MEINPEIVLNGCHFAALMLIIALPILLPGCTAASSAAGAIYSVTWTLKIVLRLWRKPSLRYVLRTTWRRCLIEVIGLYALL